MNKKLLLEQCFQLKIKQIKNITALKKYKLTIRMILKEKKFNRNFIFSKILIIKILLNSLNILNNQI